MEETVKEDTGQLWVGINSEHSEVVWAEETQAQINKLMTDYELDLVAPQTSKKIEWLGINNPEEKRTILQYIVEDRRRREHDFMADRPPFAIVTVKKGKIVRLEFYEGHDELSKTYDLRSASLQGKELKDSYREGGHV